MLFALSAFSVLSAQSLSPCPMMIYLLDIRTLCSALISVPNASVVKRGRGHSLSFAPMVRRSIRMISSNNINSHKHLTRSCQIHPPLHIHKSTIGNNYRQPTTDRHLKRQERDILLQVLSGIGIGLYLSRSSRWYVVIPPLSKVSSEVCMVFSSDIS